MRRSARALAVLCLAVCLLFTLAMSVSAAATATQDGLEVTIATDKATYAAGEEIKVTVSIKNNNTYDVDGINVETMLPKGLQVKNGDLNPKNITVEAGQTFAAVVAAEPVAAATPTTAPTTAPTAPAPTAPAPTTPPQKQDTPATGDDFQVMLWLVLVVASVCGIVLVLKCKQGTKFLCLLLCVAMVLPMIPTDVNAAEDTASITVDTKITADSKDYTISATVTYPAEPLPEGSVKVVFDLNYEGATASIPTQVVTAGECAVEPAPVERTGYIFTGWYLDKDDTDYDNYYNFSIPITENVTLYAIWVKDVDSDGDGLLDTLEAQYGTDKNKQDTDGDGLTDFQEIMVFSTDPLKQDTDGNGTPDGAEDFDEDGLTILAELQDGTDPQLADTDDDGLTDGEEKNSYGTNPLVVDTDSDGVSDGKEIELGTNPLSAQTSFQVTASAEPEENGEPAPSVEIELSGSQVETLVVEPVEDEVLLPETMPGYVSQPYEFSVEGDFEEATISFPINAAARSASDLVICYFNEETQELEALETTIVGDMATAKVTHFSKYILIDRKVYEDSFTWVDVWDSEQTYTAVEIVMVIDDSGSLGGDYYYNSSTNTFYGGGTDPEHKRLEVARDFVDQASNSAKIGIVKFDGNVDDMMGGLVTCDEAGKTSLKNQLQFTYMSGGEYNVHGIFDSRGQTYMYTGIKQALNMFSAGSDETLKVVVVFTDGQAHDSEYHNSVINTANEKGVKIYTVGLGTSSNYFTNYLQPLASNTGGSFYYADNADELAAIYGDIKERIDIETDSDDDGIPDYYEDNMITFNGVKLVLDKNNPDSDGDGLKDGEEVELKYEYNADETQVKVTGRLILGNPIVGDTDGDGYTDDVDANPFVPYKTPVILIHGLNSHASTFGVNTGIPKGKNDHYGKDLMKSLNNQVYTDCKSHQISGKPTGLAGYMESTMGYQRNKNLFAFSYPNQDMVQYNATRLEGYIESLIDAAQRGVDKPVVDAKYLFATKDDVANGHVQFILIGHSMGGLVSRYYIENLGTTKVQKLITICTPHYGSGMANASDALLNSIRFCPSIYDLDTGSTLYGGSVRNWDLTWRFGENAKVTQYALDNQSPALKGTHNGVHYYAIGGYSVDHGLVFGEASQLAGPLQRAVFSFEFGRNTSSKDAFKNSINGALNAISLGKYGESSYLDLGDSNGDNTVDYMSQFAVRFKLWEAPESIALRRTVMVVDSETESDRFQIFGKVFHNRILTKQELYKNVDMLIGDPIN